MNTIMFITLILIILIRVTIDVNSLTKVSVGDLLLTVLPIVIRL